MGRQREWPRDTEFVDGRWPSGVKSRERAGKPIVYCQACLARARTRLRDAAGNLLTEEAFWEVVHNDDELRKHGRVIYHKRTALQHLVVCKSGQSENTRNRARKELNNIKCRRRELLENALHCQASTADASLITPPHHSTSASYQRAPTADSHERCQAWAGPDSDGQSVAVPELSPPIRTFGPPALISPSIPHTFPIPLTQTLWMMGNPQGGHPERSPSSGQYVSSPQHDDLCQSFLQAKIFSGDVIWSGEGYGRIACAQTHVLPTGSLFVRPAAEDVFVMPQQATAQQSAGPPGNWDASSLYETFLPYGFESSNSMSLAAHIPRSVMSHDFHPGIGQGSTLPAGAHHYHEGPTSAHF